MGVFVHQPNSIAWSCDEILGHFLMAPTVGDMLRIAKAGLELSITKMSKRG